MSRIERMPRQSDINPLESPVFAERVALLNASQHWDGDALRRFQLKQLRALIQHAGTHVPHYRDCFKSLGVTWKDFESVEDLRRLPMVTKPYIQEHIDRFIADDVDKDSLYHRATGGSTGSPLIVYMDHDHVARDKANTEYYMNVAGLDIFSHRSLRIYGDRIDREETEKGVYWRRANDRQLVMSCYHITSDTAPAYVRAINDFAPSYIHTRPSAIAPLASAILEGGLKLAGTISHIFCDGEYLTEGQRDMIESAFSARIFNVYGHTEGCVFGHSCAHSRLLHFPPQVGVLEVLDADGEPVPEDGGRGEMVVTGFNNRMMPLIRYRTGDVGVRAAGPCPCGRDVPLLKEVEGRFQDYVVSRDGALVPLAPAVFNYNDFDWKGVAQFKVHQDRPGELHFAIMRDAHAVETPEAMRLRFVNELAPIFGDGFAVTAEFVEQLPRTAIGKFRYLEQKLDIRDYAAALGAYVESHD